ncbi:hypothetical protein N7520_003026 [Penicillium odoratum]|uniref:uncharacterized protein n=1 Tax=Penicillium odoratum TaxID=1167516 RepID=UPI002549B927|nr:uncharacterized protein N7520_003026 [Penicillium odoratum]KAJ5772497.1 hypothetical protein N7520_003026 [Penicillium odoratum]
MERQEKDQTRSIYDFFKRPAFSKPNQHLTPKKQQKTYLPSSPECPIDLTSKAYDDPVPFSIQVPLRKPALPVDPEPDDELQSSLIESVNNRISTPTPTQSPTPAPTQSFESIQSTTDTLPSLQNGNLQNSQRIVKGGKEVVISSDGEETDSDSSIFEDPALLIGSRPKPAEKPRPKIISAPKHIATTPKKYKNTIDALVHGAVDDNETEANVARARAIFNQRNSTVIDSGEKTNIHENMLKSALGEKENDDDGIGVQRLLDAVRRTEALDLDKTWRFLDQTQDSPIPVEFPKDRFAPDSHLAVLREPESRERAFQSGVLEFAASLQRLPDELILWLFRSTDHGLVPYEPREELRQAYVRVLTIAPKQPDGAQIKSVLYPGHIDELFRPLRVKPAALDFSKAIVEDYHDRKLRLPPFANDTRERAIQILLRISLDTALTEDYMIRSELQSCIGALFQSVPASDAEQTEHRICKIVYDTFREPQFQSRMLQNILPTTMWISRLRYRLAVAFLLRNDAALTEPIQDVLDLGRLTHFLASDERFQVKAYKARGDYDYGELTANAILLDIAINTALSDLNYQGEDTDKRFNEAIDILAAQIKRTFSSIEDTGASHLKRMLAKETLESVHYRMLYSVRSKPPPKKSAFKSSAKQTNGTISSHFKPRTIDRPDELPMPIRRYGTP